MTSKTFIRIALVSAAVAVSSTAFAGGSHQTHHCKQADGSMDMTKTKKACMADKGTWVKDAAASAPAPAASAAPKK